MTLCEYCGDPADTRDHLYPVAWSGGESGTAEGRGPWVWACRDCNCRLNEVGLFTVEERTAWVKDLLRRKFAKHLRAGWPDDDESELGPGLRQFRAKRGLQLAHILSRLAHPQLADWERDPAKVKQVARWGSMLH